MSIPFGGISFFKNYLYLKIKFYMSNKKILLFVFIFFFLFVSKNALAEITFNNIEVFDIVDRTAKVRWNTSQETKGDVYYGENQNNLDRWMGYSLYSIQHETVLSGLDDDKDYYYKIVATNSAGETSETFINSFNTDNIADTIRPTFLNQEIVQTTSDAVTVSWVTDEDTKAEIWYGFEDDRDKKVIYSGYKKNHILPIYKLDNDSRYSLMIIAEDRSKNKTESRVLFFNTSSGDTTHTLVISNIKPQGPGDQMIGLRDAKITWNTNFIAKGLLTYGTSENSLNKKIYVSPDKATEHIAVLSGLEPNTRYYYRIKAYESLYNKTAQTAVLNFTTKNIKTNLKTGDIVKGSGPKVYIIKGNNKYSIPNETVFNALGLKWSWLDDVDDSKLAEYKNLGDISSTKHPDGALIKYDGKSTVYVIEGGKKRPILTASAFNKLGYDWSKIINLSKTSKFKYTTGKNIQ